jgi:FkbM family methyltransferase
MYKLFQSLPYFKGKFRFAKLFFFRNSIPRTFCLPSGIVFSVPNLIENVSFELFINGVYEKKYLKLMEQNLPLNSIFFDVGANVGAISVLLAKRRPDVTIYAFEASPRVFQYLKINKDQNALNNLNIFNIAIHTKDHLELPFYSPLDKNGKGSFSPVFTKENEMVYTLSLDTFIKNNNIIPNLIKVDVEGYEKLIFESMDLYLSNSLSCPILFEFVDWAEKLANYDYGEAQQKLLNLNYKLFDLELNNDIYSPILSGSTMILAKK